jgi:hypothetical protein
MLVMYLHYKHDPILLLNSFTLLQLILLILLVTIHSISGLLLLSTEFKKYLSSLIMICQGTTAQAKPCKLQAEPGSNFCHLHKNASIVVRQRCAAYSKNGRRCKNNTLHGIYCYSHHRAKGVRIKTSTIPDAGLGLFATKEFHRGENIAPYSGDIIPEDDLDAGDLYALQIKKTPPRLFISARRTNTGAGRYANARRGDQGDNNSQLVYDRVGRVGNVRATTTIRPEQEVTVPYGRGYWHGRGLAGAAEKYISRLPASTNSQ